MYKRHFLTDLVQQAFYNYPFTSFLPIWHFLAIKPCMDLKHFLQDLLRKKAFLSDLLCECDIFYNVFYVNEASFILFHLQFFQTVFEI